MLRLPFRAHCKQVANCFIVLFLALGIQAPQFANAFNYFGSGSDGTGSDWIVHPGGYSGTGGQIEIVVAIDADSPHAAEMAIPVQNAVTRWNALLATTNNDTWAVPTVVPADKYDFESVALHEIGHALGLGHPNMDFESGATAAQSFYSAGLAGPNKKLDLAPGADNVPGTADDVRGDDINLNYFWRGRNNPFALPSVIDKTTYSRNLSALPAGHRYAAYPEIGTSSPLGHLSRGAMVQGIDKGQAVRTLAADDVAGIRYAQAGLDETAGTGDDYTLRIRYRGLVTQDDMRYEAVNVLISFRQYFDPGFAATQPDLYFIPGSTHLRTLTSLMVFSDKEPWFYNSVPLKPCQNPRNPLDVDGDGTPAPLDVLQLANTLNDPKEGARAATNCAAGRFYDVDGDNFVAPLDALLVVNFLNTKRVPLAEGESAATSGATATIAKASVAERLDKQFGFYAPDWLKTTYRFFIDLSFNTQKAKFILDASNNYFYITPDGSLYRWAGTFPASSFVATLNTDYYRNPALLYDASTLKLPPKRIS